MAIVDARIQRTLRLSETNEKQTKRLSATQDFLVISDTKNPSFSDILANTATFTNLGGVALPQLGDEVTVNGVTLVVSSRNLSWHDGSDRVVLMSVQYSGRDEVDGVSPPDSTNEETWRRISVRTQQVTQPARGWKSFDEAVAANADLSLPPRNSAGDPVDGIEEDTAVVAATYTNPNVVSPNFDQLNSYVNKCNGVDPFLGGSFYTVRCVGWSGDYDEKTQTWSISVEFLYNPKGWEIRYINAGFNQVINGSRVAIVDGVGTPVSQPVPLDANGAALAPGNANVLTRVLYPYEAVNMGNIWDDCGIR